MQKILSTIFLTAIAIIVLTSLNAANAQSLPGVMTLKEVLQYSLKENTDVKKQNLTLIKSRYATKEVISQGLPQINAEAQLHDNLQVQQQQLPGEIFGEPGTVKMVEMGTQYSIPLKVKLTQMIYSQAYFTAIQQGKAAEELTKVQSEKMHEDVIYQVASAFYQALITGEQLNLIRANLEQITQSLKVVQSQYDNQMARRIDLDQLKVSQSNTQTDLDNATIAYSQYLDYLKILMGYPINDTLELIETSDSESSVVLQNNVSNNSVLTLLQKQETLKELEIKGIRAQYLPTLSAFAQYNYQSQFNHWSSDQMNWHSSSIVGASLSIPIFDGFQKRHQIKQSQLDLQSIQLERELAQNQLMTQYRNAEKTYLLNQKTVQNQQANLDLARSVYHAVQNNYKNGISSFSDLVNADSGVKGAQTQYLTALLQSKISGLDLLNVNGNMTDLLK